MPFLFRRGPVRLALVLTLLFSAGCRSVDELGARVLLPEKTGRKAVLSFGKASRERLPSTLKVLVLNARYGESQNWLSDFVALSQSRDLILLQGVKLRGELDEALRWRRGYSWELATAWLDGAAAATPIGVASGARVPSTKRIAVRSEGGEALFGPPRVALLSLFPMASGPALLVCNLEALEIATMQSYDAHLVALEGWLAGHKGPVFVAGEFAAWTESRRERLDRFAVAAKLKAVTVSGERSIFLRGLKLLDSRNERPRREGEPGLLLELARDPRT